MTASSCGSFFIPPTSEFSRAGGTARRDEFLVKFRGEEYHAHIDFFVNFQITQTLIGGEIGNTYTKRTYITTTSFSTQLFCLFRRSAD